LRFVLPCHWVWLLVVVPLTPAPKKLTPVPPILAPLTPVPLILAPLTPALPRKILALPILAPLTPVLAASF
jgi:hypothetical protein